MATVKALVKVRVPMVPAVDQKLVPVRLVFEAFAIVPVVDQNVGKVAKVVEALVMVPVVLQNVGMVANVVEALRIVVEVAVTAKSGEPEVFRTSNRLVFKAEAASWMVSPPMAEVKMISGVEVAAL